VIRDGRAIMLCINLFGWLIKLLFIFDKIEQKSFVHEKVFFFFLKTLGVWINFWTNSCSLTYWLAKMWQDHKQFVYGKILSYLFIGIENSTAI
jgi:hypothetical protein